MKTDANGVAVCGVQFGMLGARLIDIPGEVNVLPATGGMSITQVAITLRRLVSPSHGGMGTLALFAVKQGAEWQALQIVPMESHMDKTHSVVEPVAVVDRAAYIQALCATKPTWGLSDEYIS